jgi:hypothetical protein
MCHFAPLFIVTAARLSNFVAKLRSRLEKTVIFDPASDAVQPVFIRFFNPYNSNFALQQHLFRGIRMMRRHTESALEPLTGNERSPDATIKPIAT